MFLKDIDTIELNKIVKIVERLENKKSTLPSLKMTFLSNITVNIMLPYLKYLCYQEKLRPIISLSNYNTIMQDTINSNSQLYQFEPDIILICLKMEILSKKLSLEFASINPADVKKEVKRILEFVDTALNNIRKNSNATIFLHNFEIPTNPDLGIFDYQHKSCQINTFRSMNLELIDIIKRYKDVYIIDIELLKSKFGYSNFFDNRYWFLAKSPYSAKAFKLIAKEYIKFIKAIKGKNKKCLILDCDNTLWGGLIGEDGINNIQIGNDYPGCAYKEFQQSILNLYHRGVMLALCSKNNKKDVVEVFNNHPDMILKKEHFIIMKINWKDKVQNIKDIAQDLNIGTDSLVFVDDSNFEINLVNQILPEVSVLHLPGDFTLYSKLLSSSGLFDSLNFSEEDKTRNRMYKEDLNRKKVINDFPATNLEDYYKYLEMVLEIKSADDFSIPRIAQLTQRTNQFNLVTKKYQETEIKAIIESGNADIYYLKLKDRFGESGIVGVAILVYKDKDCIINTFLLSCRILGRGVEDAFLKFCIDSAISKEYKRIIGLYKPTKKNSFVKDFYQNHMFEPISINNESKDYIFYTEKNSFDYPDFFKKIITPNLETKGRSPG